MAYRIEGLDPSTFAPLFAMHDAQLAAINARRVVADADRGYPCRVSLEDARAGESLILLNHVSHDVATPFRSSYAIYVRAAATRAEIFEDCTPPVFEGRPLAFRAFDAQGMMRDARLAAAGEADVAIRTLFENDEIAYLHAHNAAHGCYAARVLRN
ncbi:MAG: DUF1203 domain-containing protein [Sphingobium sp.]